MISLEKLLFRNLNIKLAFFEVVSHSQLFIWYKILQCLRKLLCFALLSLAVFKLQRLSVPLGLLSTSLMHIYGVLLNIKNI